MQQTNTSKIATRRNKRKENSTEKTVKPNTRTAAVQHELKEEPAAVAVALKD
jgi:hypothetical protein